MLPKTWIMHHKQGLNFYFLQHPIDSGGENIALIQKIANKWHNIKSLVQYFLRIYKKNNTFIPKKQAAMAFLPTPAQMIREYHNIDNENRISTSYINQSRSL